LQEDIYNEYLEELKSRVEGIKIGDPLSTTTQLGPLATLTQLQNIEEKIKQTIEQGGKIITGGNKVSEFKYGYYFEPTIIECANHNLPVAENELFGPVLSVMRFKDEKNAIKLMNDNSFGLAAGIFTENNGIAKRVSKAVQACIVFVNT
jgi:NAD-dependent aldehyde dehydrogenases